MPSTTTGKILLICRERVRRLVVRGDGRDCVKKKKKCSSYFKGDMVALTFLFLKLTNTAAVSHRAYAITRNQHDNIRKKKKNGSGPLRERLPGTSLQCAVVSSVVKWRLQDKHWHTQGIFRAWILCRQPAFYQFRIFCRQPAFYQFRIFCRQPAFYHFRIMCRQPALYYQLILCRRFNTDGVSITLGRMLHRQSLI